VSRRAAACLALLAPLAACDSTVTLSAAKLSEPVAVAVVTNAAGRERVFVANASRDGLRVYDVAASLFVRGPNAISPLAIELGFRPSRLAAGRLDGSGLGYVAVVGSSPEVALIDAQALGRTRGADDGCDASGAVRPGCLPGPAVDVAAAARAPLVFAAVPGSGTEPPRLFRMSVASDGGVPVLSMDATIALEGVPSGLATRADGATVYVADLSSPRVMELGSGGLRSITAAGPVFDVALSPAWTADDGTAHPEGEFLLAILGDGRLQVLDPAAGGPAKDPIDASRSIAALNFGTPIRDLAVVPCPDAPGAPCRTTLATSSTSSIAAAGLVFASLGDGTAVALVPDARHPQLYRPVLLSTPLATVSAPALAVPGVAAPAGPTLTQLTGTSGVTRSESWTVTYEGVLPRFANRSATLRQDASGLQLVDAEATAFDGDALLAGDRVVVTPAAGAPCQALAGGRTLLVAAASASRALLEQGALDLTGCLPVRVVYTVTAGGARPWTVVGSSSGLVGRAGQGETEAAAPVFTYEGTRFYYPATDPTTGLLPADGPALSFAIVGPPDTVPGTTFTFATTSGLSPFLLGSEGLATATSGGLANGVAATRERLFLVEVATNRFVEVALALVGQAGAVRVYQ
jgi:hypothetical protein